MVFYNSEDKKLQTFIPQIVINICGVIATTLMMMCDVAGKVLFNFTTTAIRLDLIPRDGLEGYLQLKSLSNGTYHIVVDRDVDLNELNPTSYPVSRPKP